MSEKRDKCSLTSLAPYLFDGRFVICFNGDMYLHMHNLFIKKDDGLTYSYDDIDKIYLITPVNLHMIAMGVNRWDKPWCYKNALYQSQEYPF